MIDPNRICYHCMTPLPEEGAVCPVCGATNDALENQTNQLPIGSILAGKYLVGQVLGQGGFGITYIGWDMNLDVKIAVKEYYPEGFAGRDAITQCSVLPYTGEKGAFFLAGREKFVNEARTLARFAGDPGVVSVRDYFNENSTAYIIMDYLEGPTLKALAAQSGGRLPAAEVLSMLFPVMDTLSRIHEAGLLHRDISPDNIILQPDGRAVLLDFGAARQISAAGEHSNTINVKHGFAPEEQYRTHGEQGPWSDVYALCATIYRLTTGVTPPQATDRAMGDIPLASPRELGADLPPQQEQALMQGLSVRARDRQQSMVELAHELAWFVPSPEPEPTPTPIRSHRPNTWKLVGGIVLACAVLTVLVIALGKPEKIDGKDTVASRPTVVQATVVPLTAAPAEATPAASPHVIRTEDYGVCAFLSDDDYEYLSDGESITLLNYHGGEGDVTLPGSINGVPVTALNGEFMLYAGENVHSMRIPEGVVSIGPSAFSCMTGKSTVYIPASVTDIAPGAFTNSAGVMLEIAADNPRFLFDNHALLSRDRDCLYAYLGDGGKAYAIPDGVTTICESAFFGCRGLTEIGMPDTVRSIGESAFSFCENLTQVDLPDGTISIERYAFQSCAGLTSVTIPDSVTYIGENAFESCPELTIHCARGTAAEAYAISEGLRYEAS